MKVIKKKSKTILITEPSDNYSCYVEKLVTIKDNGNGYYIKIHSHTITHPDRIFNLDYGDLLLLAKLAKKLEKE